jgi:hypothetical protein
VNKASSITLTLLFMGPLCPASVCCFLGPATRIEAHAQVHWPACIYSAFDVILTGTTSAFSHLRRFRRVSFSPRTTRYQLCRTSVLNLSLQCGVASLRGFFWGTNTLFKALRAVRRARIQSSVISRILDTWDSLLPFWDSFWGHFCNLGTTFGPLRVHFSAKKITWGARGATRGVKGRYPKINLFCLTPFGSLFKRFLVFPLIYHIFSSDLFKGLFFCVLLCFCSSWEQ